MRKSILRNFVVCPETKLNSTEFSSSSRFSRPPPKLPIQSVYEHVKFVFLYLAEITYMDLRGRSVLIESSRAVREHFSTSNIFFNFKNIFRIETEKVIFKKKLHVSCIKLTLVKRPSDDYSQFFVLQERKKGFDIVSLQDYLATVGHSSALKSFYRYSSRPVFTAVLMQWCYVRVSWSLLIQLEEREWMKKWKPQNSWAQVYNTSHSCGL